MRQSSLRLIAVSLLSLSAATSHAAGLPAQWVGSYAYEYVMRHRPGEPAPAWVFDLSIKADGSCELTWQGYQKDDDIACKASGSDRDVKIYYATFVSGDTSGLSGYTAYKPAEQLLELKRTGSNGKLWTKWGALNKENVLKDGVRFEQN